MTGAPPSSRVGFWLRVAAALLDVIVLLPLLFLAGFILVYIEEAGRLTPTIDYLFEVSASFLAVAYSACEVFLAGTPGKLILRLRIADARGIPAEPWTLAHRWGTKNLPTIIGLMASLLAMPGIERVGGIVGLVVVIGCLAALGQERRAWHDRWAGTAVYRRRDLEHVPGFAPLKVLSPTDLESDGIDHAGS